MTRTKLGQVCKQTHVQASLFLKTGPQEDSDVPPYLLTSMAWQTTRLLRPVLHRFLNRFEIEKSRCIRDIRPTNCCPVGWDLCCIPKSWRATREMLIWWFPVASHLKSDCWQRALLIRDHVSGSSEILIMKESCLPSGITCRTGLSRWPRRKSTRDLTLSGVRFWALATCSTSFKLYLLERTPLCGSTTLHSRVHTQYKERKNSSACLP